MKSLYESIIANTRIGNVAKFADDVEFQRQIIADTLVELFGCEKRIITGPSKTGYFGNEVGTEFETNIPNNETRKVSKKLKEFVDKMNSFHYFTNIREIAGIKLPSFIRYKKWLQLDKPGQGFENIRVVVFSYPGNAYLILGIIDSSTNRAFDWNKYIK